MPPVEMTVTPMSVRPLANDSTPLLLKTEISARLTFTMLLLRMTCPGARRTFRAASLDCRKPTRKVRAEEWWKRTDTHEPHARERVD